MKLSFLYLISKQEIHMVFELFETKQGRTNSVKRPLFWVLVAPCCCFLDFSLILMHFYFKGSEVVLEQTVIKT